MGNTDKRSASSVQTIDRLFRIVEVLEEMEGARVSEIGARLELADSTVHRYLKALHANQYVVKEGDAYDLALRFLDLGDYARNRTEVARLAKPKVKQLAEASNERAEYMTEEFGRAIFVHREIGPNAVQADSRLGKRLPLHATSAGKAILAFLPTQRVREIIDRYGLEKCTEHTIVNEDRLLEELAQIREEQVSFAEQEYINGLNTVSVPLMTPNDEVCGALGISGPTHRLKGERFHEEIPSLLLGTANELELNMTYA